MKSSCKDCYIKAKKEEISTKHENYKICRNEKFPYAKIAHKFNYISAHADSLEKSDFSMAASFRLMLGLIKELGENPEAFKGYLNSPTQKYTTELDEFDKCFHLKMRNILEKHYKRMYQS